MTIRGMWIWGRRQVLYRKKDGHARDLRDRLPYRWTLLASTASAHGGERVAVPTIDGELQVLPGSGYFHQ